MLSCMSRKTDLSTISRFPSEPNIPGGPDYEKISHYIDAWGNVYQLHTETT